jgi:hypothetical protein
MLPSNEIDIYATTPSSFPAKKAASLNTVDTPKKVDEKSNDIKRDSLPVFLLDPTDAYIIRSKSADLSCKVVGADKTYFTCNGEAMAAADRHKEEDRVEVVGDEMVPVKELTIEINRNQARALKYYVSCCSVCKVKLGLQ